MKVLDVGCGTNKFPGAIGLDNNPRTDADVLHDLGVVPYPFKDDEFDLVVARHVVEHVPDVIAFIEELYRITKNGGRIELATPHFTNGDWSNDPTHRNHLNSYSFDTFVIGEGTFDFYTHVQLERLRRYVSVANLWRFLGVEFMINLDHRYPGLRFVRKFWEQYANAILRGKEIEFEFKVVKAQSPDGEM